MVDGEGVSEGVATNSEVDVLVHVAVGMRVLVGVGELGISDDVFVLVGVSISPDDPSSLGSVP